MEFNISVGIKMKNIIIASDHGAVALKDEIMSFLRKQNCTIKDMGVSSLESVDYPDIVCATCAEFKKGGYDFGILLCGTGIGMTIAANKVKGIRAAVCTNEFCAEMTRRHNDANILCMGGRVIDEEKAVALTKIYLETPFEGGRHQRRIDEIAEIERGEL